MTIPSSRSDSEFTTEQFDLPAPANRNIYGAVGNTAKNDVTAQLCASCYVVPGFAQRLYSQLFSVDDRTSCGASPGIDFEKLAKHCKQAYWNHITFRIILLGSMFLWIKIIGLTSIADLLLLGCGIFAIYVKYRLVCYSNARSIKRGRSACAINLSAHETIKVAEQEKCKNANLHVYSGFVPFNGDAGLEHGEWSLTVDLTKPKSDLRSHLSDSPQASPQDFSVQEIYDTLSSKLDQLQIPGLKQEDVAYIDGETVRQYPLLLPNPKSHPINTIPQEYLRKLSEQSKAEDGPRFYKKITISSWHDELIATLFFRVKKLPNSLYLETNYYFLPPLHADLLHPISFTACSTRFFRRLFVAQDLYFALHNHGLGLLDPTQNPPPIKQQNSRDGALDRVAGNLKFLEFLHILLTSSVLVIVLFLSFDFIFIREIFNGIRFAIIKMFHKLFEDACFDHGCKKSVRVSVTDTQYGNFFIKQDKNMYMMTMERRVLDSLINFLDQKGIDTHDLHSRQEALINQGVIIGGTAKVSGKSRIAGLIKVVNTIKRG